MTSANTRLHQGQGGEGACFGPGRAPGQKGLWPANREECLNPLKHTVHFTVTATSPATHKKAHPVMYGAPTIACKPTNNGTSKFGCHATTNKLSFLNRKIKKTVFKKITFHQATPCDVVEHAYQWYARSDESRLKIFLSYKVTGNLKKTCNMAMDTNGYRGLVAKKLFDSEPTKYATKRK